MDKFEQNKKLKIGYCGNCGKFGHKYKFCREPITSFGIILIKLDNGDKLSSEQLKYLFDPVDSKTNITQKVNGVRCINNFELNLFSLNKDKVKFLLIQRRHTLGYSEFIRGRYVTENIDGIIFLFQQMTQNEIINIGQHTFDELWDDFWTDDEKKNIFAEEYKIAKTNFNKLQGLDGSVFLNLDFYIKNVTPTWENPEWGFPKGRRNLMESDLECATREFEEETGFIKEQYNVLPNIEPLIEDLIGTNGKRYRHIYYLAITYQDVVPKIEKVNVHQSEEIGDIGLFTYEEAINMIRSYHTERKKIITISFIYMLNKFVNRREDIIPSKEDPIAEKVSTL